MGSSRNKIIFFVAVFAALVGFLWFAVYVPIKGRNKQVMSEFQKIQGEIRDIEKYVDPGKPAAELMQTLSERYERVSSRFPAKEDESIGMLSEIGRKYNIEISSVASQAKSEFKSRGDQSFQVEGKTCRVLSVNLSFHSTYHDLIRYIEAVEQTLSAYVTVQSLSISPQENGRLGVSMELSLYLLS